MLPVFSYWNGTQSMYEKDFLDTWSKTFCDFKIYSLSDAVSIAQKYFPERSDIITDIAIPAAQSDVCRFIMLYEHGGLYTDCHFSFTDPDAVKAFYLDVHDHDLVVVDNKLWRERRSEDQLLLINGFLFAQPRHPFVLECLTQMFENLDEQRNREAAYGWQPYDIWSLTGPWLLNAEVFDNIAKWPPTDIENTVTVVKEQYRNYFRIIREEDLPVQRNVHGSYNGIGRHWSERQKNECLFLSSSKTG